ncbi:MAG: DNA methyltransferase [Pseudomonadota bacterium]
MNFRLDDGQLDAFIARWQAANGPERANYQLFLTELTELLGLPRPEPASDDTRDNGYVFERRVDIRNADGSVNRGFIDLYRRGSFVLEAKQTGKELDTDGWDRAMLRAQAQADQYARALPANEGRPPFIVVVDVGRSIELYAEFTRSGGAYVPYPDPAHHRIRLADLRDEAIQDRLRKLWLDPLKLDPSREAARVTRAIADQLARLAKSLEAAGHAPQRVAHFLMRALFTMFAEDVGLLPAIEGKGAFTSLLESLQERPAAFAPALESLWQTMNRGGFDPRLMERIRTFNGGLFATPDVIPLDRDQIGLLLQASRADWRFVEPAIFGTLLERALDPRERHKLGAHYTPRAYVERLVLPTLIEPLRRDWQTAQVAALAWRAQGRPDKALEEVRAFHHQLCHTRVLDPACGSGNFLYVALEHMKRLEGEVLNLLADLGETQGRLDMAGVTVDPHQFLGLEINPRAAAIAEMVLWIGYLQWHHRIHKSLDGLPDPVLRDFHNIEHRDALMEYDGVEYLTDEAGRPLTRWDGITTKTSPVTGEAIPDETARVPIERYINPRKAEWPEAEYIVGNPPFIGKLKIREALGDGYVDALRATWPEVPESADFVMYWWQIAAETVRAGKAKQFGFITTNSIRQIFNRRVLEAQLNATKNPLALAFAIPDHPWVDAADGAAVRIAMTVGRAEPGEGLLLTVTDERETGEDAHEVTLARREGVLHADLTMGANVAGAVPLKANKRLSTTGVIPHGAAMVLTPEQAGALEPDAPIRPYRNGKDLMDRPRGVLVIDCYGLTSEQVRERYPKLYQWLVERVKPERDVNRDKDLREMWWLHRRNNEDMRESLAGLRRYIATVMTAKHRLFVFLDGAILPDQVLVNIAVNDAFHLGMLSSRIHVAWALAAGGRLGMGNDARYNKTRCFETFPFPEATPAQAERIRNLAEQIDAHRKRQQAAHPELTLTGLYNVLEKLRAGETLTAKDKAIHEAGLVSVLKALHDDLDAAVFTAYGWHDLAEKLVGRPGATTPLPDKPAEHAAAEEELLTRLVALNAQRAAEEAQGHIRWLRPDYQNPEGADLGSPSSAPMDLDLPEGAPTEEMATQTAPATQTWPKDLREQIQAVRALLSGQPQTVEALAARFKRKPSKAVQTVLEALEGLGLARRDGDGWRV